MRSLCKTAIVFLLESTFAASAALASNHFEQKLNFYVDVSALRSHHRWPDPLSSPRSVYTFERHTDVARRTCSRLIPAEAIYSSRRIQSDGLDLQGIRYQVYVGIR